MSDSTRGWTNDGNHDPDVATFIVEGDDCVHRIVAGARDELHRLTRNAHLSFASAISQTGPASREARRAVVEAIYLHLKHDYHFVYEFERAFDSATGEQMIRLPAATCRDNAGTCIDLAVLFLSCLAGAKLLPIFLQVQFGRVAHALAATWVVDPPPKRVPFLTLDELRRGHASGELLVIECTGFVEGVPGRPHKLSFAEACEEAEKLLHALGAGTGRFRFALDVRRAWESGFHPGSRTELQAALDSAVREGMFRPGGLCQGYPLRALPDRYFVGRELRPDDDLRGALSDALAALRVRPVSGEDHVWPGHVLCKLAAMIRGTAFGVYQIAPAQDRNVCLELGMAKGIGRPFVLVREPGAALTGLLEGLDHFAADSCAEVRHEMGPKVQDFLVEVGRQPSAPLPAAGSRATAFIAHGGLDVLDFAVAAGKAVTACGLTPVFPGDPTGKVGEYLGREGIAHEVLGAAGGWRLDEAVAAIQEARLGVYRVEETASPDAFVALGLSLGLSRPGLLVRRARQGVPADLRGLSTLEFRSYTALERDLAGCCGAALRGRSQGDGL